MLVLLFSWLRLVPAKQCFADGIPEFGRRELVNDGQVYPVGLFVLDYAAQHATAELVNILLQEKMGYVVQKMVNGSLASHAFFALAGCARPTDYSDRGCSEERTTRAHISVEGWTAGYPKEWQLLQRDYPSVAPRNLGSMGYVGTTSLFIPSHVQELAYNAEGLSLDFYRDYNTSWRQPAQFFTRIEKINRSKLMVCEDTSLMNVEVIKVYLEITGDHEGVSQGNESIRGRCFDQHFWYAPACRSNASSCILSVTGGTGWGISEMLQKATLLGMPLAWATANGWEAYTSLPMDYDAVFYWWTPDPTFLRLNAKTIIFPAHDAVEWSKNIRGTAATRVQIDKYISQDLTALAPDIEEFMNNYQVDIQHVEKIMLDKLQFGESYFDAACRWLLANGDWWRKWIPDKTKCFARYGLYNPKEEKFVDNRANPNNLKCEVCSPGSFSDTLQDDNGTTFVCRDCYAGSYQVFGASTMCNACQTGEYQNETGQNSCHRCGFGAYQDVIGQSSCKLCPAGTTTTGLGSLFITDCGCIEKTINVAKSQGLFQCVPCPEGLTCPFGSTVQSLQQGEAPLGPQYVPQLLEGYWSDSQDPVSIYKCEPRASCPGGKPGDCAGGLSGIPCARCPGGQTWAGKECAECSGVTFVLWAIVPPLCLVCLLKSYDLVDSKADGEASPLQACLIAAGIAFNVMQTIAVFGLMSVTWSQSLSSASSGFQIFLLDLDQLGLNCVLGSNNVTRFLLRVAIFPVASLTLLSRWALAVRTLPCPRFLPQRCRVQVKKWVFFKTMNCIGKFLQVGFATFSAVSLQPLMCYHHPNGLHSILKYPSTFCGDSEHVIMIVIGMVLMAIFVVGFFAACSLAAWKMPTWSLKEDHRWVQSFTFLTGKFRLDTWWFGMLLLLRGFALSITVVLGTDRPQVQIALASLVMLLYLCALVRVWPWKARVLNVADTALSAGMLLLVRQASAATLTGDQFNDVFSALILVLVSGSAVFMLLMCIFALLFSWRYGDGGRSVLHLGADINAETMSKALKDCAAGLLKIESAQLKEKLGKINTYDLEALQATITLVSLELIQSPWRFNSRVALQAIRGEAPSTDGCPQEQHVPVQAPPVLSVLPEQTQPHCVEH
ncbi:unnamed protein product [Durusdinium trenchii]|uniref:Tyrosine-protein kinase ephrin type A/B receptor-like domain-containing protein n=1 Tax=Durusdinium trenchii TaxID=1381693 RepID=A0ABP0J084_9DINO